MDNFPPRAVMCDTHQPPRLKLEPMCPFLGECEIFNYLASAPANLNNFFLNSCSRPGVALPHNGPANTRLAALYHPPSRRRRRSLLTGPAPVE